MLAEGADRAGALPVFARALRRVIAVEHMRIAAHRAVLRDQRVVRDFLAALARDQHLALRDERGREIEDDRVLALARDAHAERRGGECAVDAAERRHQHAAAHIDEMDRDEAFAPPPSRPIRRRGRHGRNSSGQWQKAPSPCISRCRARPPAAPWSGRSHIARRGSRAPACRPRASRSCRRRRRRPASISHSAARARRRGCHGRRDWSRRDIFRSVRSPRSSSRRRRKCRR